MTEDAYLPPGDSRVPDECVTVSVPIDGGRQTDTQPSPGRRSGDGRETVRHWPLARPVRGPRPRTVRGHRTHGMTGRESTHDKGRRYLTEGRLTVRQVSRAGVIAFVRGDSGLVYHAEWSPDLDWSCNCPARTDRCAHLVALRLVTVAGQEPCR